MISPVAMTIRTPKGTRDILPSDKIKRNKIINILTTTFEQYGFNPIETPALEMQDTLASKFAGGEEILKEIYQITDNADRKMGLRYDLTVPFARVMAMNPELSKPFKRYQIDRVWRNGPIKLGRYREFWQCDVDVAGVGSQLAEAELLALSQHVFSHIAPVTILVNSRCLLSDVLTHLGVAEDMQSSAILTLDKLDKIGKTAVAQELKDKGITHHDDLLAVMARSYESNEQLLDWLSQRMGETQGIESMRELLRFCAGYGVTPVVSISLARGLTYYTGAVWEVYSATGVIKSSLAGGGRYDKMIGHFFGGGQQIPAVGMSFGLDVITDLLDILSNETARGSVVNVLVIPLTKRIDNVLPIVAALRKAGINTDLEMTGRSLNKAIAYANKLNIPYVIIVGDDELDKEVVTFKDLAKKTQRTLSITQLINDLQL